MPERIVEVATFSPLHFGDGRPFAVSDGDETHARSRALPMPNTLAGFVRTQIMRAQGKRGTREDLSWLHAVPVYGPVLVSPRDVIVLPAPKDAVLYETDGKAHALKPSKTWGGGTDLPDGMLPLVPPKIEKTVQTPPFWTQAYITKWLLGEEVRPNTEDGPQPETRVHVRIDPASSTAQTGQLFSVEYQNYDDESGVGWRLRARVNFRDGLQPETLGFLGGERRLVQLAVHEHLSEYWYDAPEEIKRAFASLGSRGDDKPLIRMTLVTPALFQYGWRPGWALPEATQSGQRPRGLSKVKLRLVAAAVGRREAVSGWSLRENKPRRVRWAVPAGSTYFFEVEDGDPASVLESWLRPVSDIEQDRKDGFGLAIWGVSNYAD